MIQKNRPQQTNSATRRVFSVLIVCWLNLAILPCAMALNGSEPCPQVESASAAESAHQGHHAVQRQQDCAMLSTDCCDLGTTAFDGRNGKSENLSDDVSTSAAVVSWPSHDVARATFHDARPPDYGGYPAPLHVLHCVYLI
jgi:hypothetical protein